jgi:uncharacterized membrane protein
MRLLLAKLRLLGKEESGQTAIAMLLTFLGVFMLASLGLDAGIWFFDHRTAQNQVDAATLAGVIDLPDTDSAFEKAKQWLRENNVDAADLPGSPVLMSGLPPGCQAMG